MTHLTTFTITSPYRSAVGTLQNLNVHLSLYRSVYTLQAYSSYTILLSLFLRGTNLRAHTSDLFHSSFFFSGAVPLASFRLASTSIPDDNESVKTDESVDRANTI